MRLQSSKDIRALRARIASLPSVVARIAQRVAAEFSRMAREDFDAQRSPNGVAWKPGKRGHPATLHKSGKLERAATTYTAIGGRVRASALSIPYARFQLRRPFMPKGVPDAWAKRAREIAREEIDAHLRGTR